MEQATTEIEKVMVQLSNDQTRTGQKCYLAGVVDTWESLGVIDETVREVLYCTYCF